MKFELFFSKRYNLFGCFRGKLPVGYHMTEFRGLALSTCDGRVSPALCSGLTIASKYPFEASQKSFKA